MNTQKPEELLETLQLLINQTYAVEDEYKELKHSYDALMGLISTIIDTLPNPIWVLNDDESILLANIQAQSIDHALLSTWNNDAEVEIGSNVYWIKIAHSSGKKIIQATDITQQKRQARLIAMGQMAAHLAHEIRNPLGSVSLLASALFGKVQGAQKGIVLEMRKGIWRVERIIRATLLFSKGVSLTKKTFAINELQNLLEEAVSYYNTTKEITYHYFLPSIPLEADYELLGLVIQNLIFNAIDAIEEDEEETGIIEVLYNTTPTHHLITIYDTGVAIKNPHELFDAFKTTKTKGTGLGLALSSQIIEAHGGELFLADTKKGFTLSLPKQ